MKKLIAYYSRAGENYFSGAHRAITIGNTEQAARLLLSRTEKVTLRGAVSKAPPRETVELLLFRQKLLDAAQDRRLTLGGRMRKILTLAGASLPRRTARAWAAFFASLEPLEPGWTEALAKLAKPVDFAGFHAVSAAWETEYEQLLVYFLLRHLLADEGRALPARSAQPCGRKTARSALESAWSLRGCGRQTWSIPRKICGRRLMS